MLVGGGFGNFKSPFNFMGYLKTKTNGIIK